MKHYIKSEKGNVLNEKGEVVGGHDGAVFFTLGERHGFTLFKHTESDKPFYVVSKDINNNTITISHRSDLWEGKESHRIVLCCNTNWISEVPEKGKKYQAQIRYHGELLDCKINYISLIVAEIILKKKILVARGQSIVIYDGDICLGGGVVN